MADADGMALSLADALEATAAAHPLMHPSDLPHILVRRSSRVTPLPAFTTMNAPGCSVECTNGDIFVEGYMRNNKKSSGQKNLRCFPSCLPDGHNTTSYCGHAVTCEAVFPASVDPNECVVFGAFEDKAENKISQRSNTYTFAVGDEVQREAIERGCRTSKDPTKPLILGAQRRGLLGELLIDMDEGSLGWHYSW